ncbi:sulfate ABC transporter ATP-binding protein CysA [Niallia circulans]|jgi:sulfate/thiosulfate transport system ATP-binding protein|uniref:sulfate/molybdate ABC transporter ATP-binding protein n=1 Tax=Niallia circulans TaxID=1397 RepID=UPI00077C571A|nr:sulfate/molybdate ABC transporter ATP-binding protein [Niallia circulans]MDR4317560.1 sulfate/molybdate ABC transporter ATP-binding protein [Niallia circulans]MED3840524.1 sulfate/molybdate ABC transporter ATP-binding protein [Niallia circulans]MED4243528.1 sulfate/molybdate ABC transporter ATP-binding protein [Niallia circulans]MED4247397.1 sulfate/molybdate ABC transporter ATP-binding protein [Niallia circulans]QKH62842.1 sulfate/molybdate ABC transporter ATP-binding protein [Niallia circ
MSILIKDVSKAFGSFQALKDIHLEINSGELVALLGPSGSGKTSLLRIIAGLETADQGVIYFGENNMTEISTKERNVGFVFQHYALFRHMTVFDNIAYGLKVRPRKDRPAKHDIESKVNELLQLVKLEELKNRYPSQLSGGQKQRVALARALAVEPKVLLLDEPFGALDAKVRKDLRRWLRRLHDEFHITSVFVTHDQEEALDVADRIVVMNEGKIEQIGSPEEVYEHPNSPFVYDFLGNVNLFYGRLEAGKLIQGKSSFSVPEWKHEHNKQAIGYVRPHDIHISKEEQGDDSILASIHHIHIVGPIVHLELKREDSDEFLEAEITKEMYRSLSIHLKDQVYVKPNQLKVFIPEDFSI